MTATLEYARRPSRHGAPWWLWTLAALSLLGGAFYFFVPWKITNRSDQARVKAASADITTLGVALDLFNQDTGRFPTAAEGLGALIQPPAGLPTWRGPYIKQSGVPRDPWAQPYVYVPPTGVPPRIVSPGPDGVTGTDDDIVSRPP